MKASALIAIGLSLGLVATIFFGSVNANTNCEYKVIEAASARSITNKVNSLIQEGWHPLGGVSPVNRLVIYQAMGRGSCQK